LTWGANVVVGRQPVAVGRQPVAVGRLPVAVGRQPGGALNGTAILHAPAHLTPSHPIPTHTKIPCTPMLNCLFNTGSQVKLFQNPRCDYAIGIL